MEVYRDERELVWASIDPLTISVIYEKYIRPSLVFREVMPAYFSIRLLGDSGNLPLELVGRLEKLYLSLFGKEFRWIPLGRDLPIFHESRKPTRLGLFLDLRRSFLVTCQQCRTTVQVSKDSCSVDSLYKRIRGDSKGEKKITEYWLLLCDERIHL